MDFGHSSQLKMLMQNDYLWQEFNPERVDVFHDYGGHQGTALVTFKKDIYGLIDAEAFEKSFAAVGRGRKEWETHNDVQRGLHLYGWQATEQV
jgi:hypothetical protein